MTEWLQPLVVLGVSVLMWELLTQRSEFGARTTLVADRHQRCLEHTAAMECDLVMCAHAVDGEHPVAMQNERGMRFWRLSDGRWWREDEPCPYR